MDHTDILAALGDVAIGRFGDILSGDASQVLEALGALDKSQAEGLAHKLAVARNINPDAVMVNRQMWKRVRKCQAGTTPVTFTSSTAVQNVQLQVLRPFLPVVLEVGSSIAPFFQINNIQINGDNQFGSTGPVQCQSLSEAAANKPVMEFDTVNTSLPLIMEVQMTDLTATRVFNATFSGVQLRK